jgi:ketosteroid isomerase-like protein
MENRDIVITGDQKPAAATSPLDALTEFYFAFNHRDIAVMSDNWLDSEDIAMSNPLGGIKRGWDEIRAVYERIFNGAAKVYVEYYDFNIVQSATMFCAIGRERGWFQKDGTKIELAIRTSRIFMLHAGRWRQAHHHGSIDAPDLLARYQAAVIGK